MESKRVIIKGWDHNCACNELEGYSITDEFYIHEQLKAIKQGLADDVRER